MKPLLVGLGIVLALAVVGLSQGYPSIPEDAVIVDLGEDDSGFGQLEAGTRGGRFSTALLIGTRSWNPITASDGGTAFCTGKMHRGLISIHPMTGVLMPELAKRWAISEDGLTITFALREGLRWSDGTPFTADDVLFTFNDLILNEHVDAGDRDALRLPDGTYPAFRKLDSHTIEVTVSIPFRPILSALTANIVPDHKLASSVHKRNPQVQSGSFNAAWGLDVDLSDLVGMGPFVLKDYVPDQYALMERNPYYYHFDPHGTQLPYVDELLISFVPCKATALLKFLNGELHAIDADVLDVPILYAHSYQRGFTVRVADAAHGYTFSTLNQDAENANLRELFRKLAFRQALAHAFDAESVLGLYHGFGDIQWSPISMASPYYAGRDGYAGPITEIDAVFYEYDLERAAEFLDACGILDTNGDGIREFADGTPVKYELIAVAGYELANRTSLIHLDDLGRLGLDVHLNLVGFQHLVSLVFSGQWEATAIAMPAGLDPHEEVGVLRSTSMNHWWHSSAAEGDLFPHEEELDQLIDLAATIYDPQEAFEIYKQIQLLFAREDLGMGFGVNPRIAIAAYDIVGNAIAIRGKANPQGSPFDLVFLREDD